MSAILVTTDLMFHSRVSSQAQAAGVSFKVARDGSSLTELLASETPVDLVMIDLSLKSLDVPSLVQTIKTAADAPFIVAYGPHVHEDQLRAAQSAGCDAVMTKGQFDRSVADLLRQYSGRKES